MYLYRKAKYLVEVSHVYTLRSSYDETPSCSESETDIHQLFLHNKHEAVLFKSATYSTVIKNTSFYKASNHFIFVFILVTIFCPFYCWCNSLAQIIWNSFNA